MRPPERDRGRLRNGSHVQEFNPNLDRVVVVVVDDSEYRTRVLKHEAAAVRRVRRIYRHIRCTSRHDPDHRGNEVGGRPHSDCDNVATLYI